MKKKTSATGLTTVKSKVPRAGKNSSGGTKGASKDALSRAKRPAAPKPRRPATTDDATATIKRLRTQLARAQARIDALQASAETDVLLDILNRRGFERELNRSIAYIKRYRASGALIVLDVDRLKPVNDIHGHAAGDALLKAIADALRAEVRSSDVIGRLGGDEFALLLWNLNESDALIKVALLEQSIDRLSFVFRGHTVTAGISAGIALLGPHSQAGTALEEADRAMYVRKGQRRHWPKSDNS